MRLASRAGLRGGQRGQLPRAPRCKGAPRDEIYLFQINTRLKNFRDSEAIQEHNSIIFLCFVKYEGHTTTTDFSTSGVGNLITIAGRMNCALSLAGRKILNRFYPKISPLSNYEEEWLLLNFYLSTCLSCSFVLIRYCTLTWVTKFWIGPYQMFTRAAGSPPALHG